MEELYNMKPIKLLSDYFLDNLEHFFANKTSLQLYYIIEEQFTINDYLSLSDKYFPLSVIRNERM